jgi:hypothetical protein
MNTMTKPTDFRALCAELVALLDCFGSTFNIPIEAPVVTRARAALAQPEPVAPTVMQIIALSDEIEAEDLGIIDLVRRALARWGTPVIHPVPVAPTDEELLKLMPETMLDEFSYAAKVCSDATGGQVKPGIFRVSLNTGALDYARAVLARWGLPQYQPIPEATNA